VAALCPNYGLDNIAKDVTTITCVESIRQDDGAAPLCAPVGRGFVVP